MGMVRIKRVYHKSPSIGECTYTTLLKTVQYASYHLFVNDSMVNTIMQHIWQITFDGYSKDQKIYLKIPSVG